VEHSQFSGIYEVKNKNDLGDNIVCFLNDALCNCNYGDIAELMLQLNSLPFTCSRTICSIAKGVRLSNKKVKITFVSNFLTYFGVISRCVDSGVMAIPFMNGKFFTCRYNNNELMDVIIQCSDSIDDAVYVDDYISSDVNLAKKQMEALSVNIVYDRLSHVRVI
jgi:hypothetical protein